MVDSCEAPHIPSIMDWFTVSIADDVVTLDVAPPGLEAWRASFRFDDIVRVCFETEGLFGSDRLYVFVRDRAESYVVPTEAIGGSAFLGALIDRQRFDAELAIEAATAGEGTLLCWPPV